MKAGKAIGLLVGGVSLMVLSWFAYKGLVQTVRPAALPVGQVSVTKAPRPSLDFSMAAMVERYNEAMKSLDRAMLLPPVSALQQSPVEGKNLVRFSHQTPKGAGLMFDIDSTTGLATATAILVPYGANLGVEANMLNMTALAVLVKASLRDPGKAQDRLLQICSSAMDSQGHQNEKWEKLELSCSAHSGVLMAALTAR